MSRELTREAVRQLSKANAENKRLREALKEIEATPTGCLADHSRIAAAALHPGVSEGVSSEAVERPPSGATGPLADSERCPTCGSDDPECCWIRVEGGVVSPVIFTAITSEDALRTTGQKVDWHRCPDPWHEQEVGE